MPLDKSGRHTKARPIEGVEFSLYLLPGDRDSFLNCLQSQWAALGMQEPIEVMI